MGNRSINSWKLSAFFIFGLMLFAAVFSNAALAAENDGKGAIVASVLTTNAHSYSGSPAFSNHYPLYAGSDTNVMRFRFTAYEGSGASAVAIDMRDGTFRLAIPDGWTVPDRVSVWERTEGPDTNLYRTTDGQQTVEDADLVKRVEVEPNKYIKIKLNTELWGRELTGASARSRQIEIFAYNVVTPVPPYLTNTGDTGGASHSRYDGINNQFEGGPTNNIPIWAYEYEFSSSSMGKNGTFIRLADANQPKVRVGSILGNKGARHTTVARSFPSRDTLDRKVVITPKQAFVGETDTKFTIEFTAPGPIYPGRITITPDAGVAPTIGTDPDADGATRGDVYKVRAPGANVTLGQPEGDSTVINLIITNIDKGQKITVTYTRKAPIAQPDTAGAPSFTSTMIRPIFVA